MLASKIKVDDFSCICAKINAKITRYLANFNLQVDILEDRKDVRFVEFLLSSKDFVVPAVAASYELFQDLLEEDKQFKLRKTQDNTNDETISL